MIRCITHLKRYTIRLAHGIAHRLIVLVQSELVNIQAEENSKWSHSILSPAEIQKRIQEETIKGEWHRTEENTAKILRLMRHVYGDYDTFMVAHHLLLQQKQWPKPYEIPSAETMFFDHAFLKSLCGEENWQGCARTIATMSQQDRLDYLLSLLPCETSELPCVESSDHRFTVSFEGRPAHA